MVPRPAGRKAAIRGLGPMMGRLGAYRRFAGLALRAGPALSAALVGSTVVAALAPLGTAVAVGVVVGAASAASRGGIAGPTGATALAGTAAVALLFAVQRAAGSFQAACAAGLGERVDAALQSELMAAAMAPPGIGHLENPEVQSLLAVGRDGLRGWLRPGRIASFLTILIAARLSVLGALVLVLRFRWPAALLLGAALVWVDRETEAASARSAEHHVGANALTRRTGYFYELGTTPPAAKEVRVFGLQALLRDRFAESWARSMRLAFGGRHPRLRWATGALAAAALGTLGWICLAAWRREFGLGPALVYAQAVLVSLSGRAATGGVASRLAMAVAALDRCTEATRAAARATPPPAPGGPVSTGAPCRSIRFEDVSFRYPGQGRPALAGLTLDVPAGRSLAIVGANGAGKTTLVKLLCGFYRPDGGRILVDGSELAGMDPGAWQRRIAAVFQDPVHFELPAAANIAVGAPGHLADAAGVEAAAARSGIADDLAALPRGWDTVLSREYRDGAELSGGQWQRLALARALFAVRHGASVLVLDEPAAHLDARAEAQLHAAFLGLTAGLTTVVISHRFSTVRQASSIAVLRDGRVAEQGTHEELLGRGGLYAEMFRLQAARFHDDPAGDAGL